MPGSWWPSESIKPPADDACEYRYRPLEVCSESQTTGSYGLATSLRFSLPETNRTWRACRSVARPTDLTFQVALEVLGPTRRCHLMVVACNP